MPVSRNSYPSHAKGYHNKNLHLFLLLHFLLVCYSPLNLLHPLHLIYLSTAIPFDLVSSSCSSTTSVVVTCILITISFPTFLSMWSDHLRMLYLISLTTFHFVSSTLFYFANLSYSYALSFLLPSIFVLSKIFCELIITFKFFVCLSYHTKIFLMYVIRGMILIGKEECSVIVIENVWDAFGQGCPLEEN